MENFYIFIFKVWLSLTIVKTIMGYVQLPLMLRLTNKHLGRKLESIEIVQLIVFAPIVNFFVVWYYVFKEKFLFFRLYDESTIEGKLKKL